MEAVPEVGKTYDFYDDGKLSRHNYAKVLRAVPATEEIIVDRFDYELGQLISSTLQTIHKEAVDDHRQSERFTVLNAPDHSPGAPWLYAEETDFFVECEIPEYDENPIWFARTVDGGWFSMNIQSSWQSGRLDVDGKLKKYRS